jgi:hypothetical protein
MRSGKQHCVGDPERALEQRSAPQEATIESCNRAYHHQMRRKNKGATVKGTGAAYLHQPALITTRRATFGLYSISGHALSRVLPQSLQHVYTSSVTYNEIYSLHSSSKEILRATETQEMIGDATMLISAPGRVHMKTSNWNNDLPCNPRQMQVPAARHDRYSSLSHSFLITVAHAYRDNLKRQLSRASKRPLSLNPVLAGRGGGVGCRWVLSADAKRQEQHTAHADYDVRNLGKCEETLCARAVAGHRLGTLISRRLSCSWQEHRRRVESATRNPSTNFEPTRVVFVILTRLSVK